MFRRLRGIPLLGCLLGSIGCHSQPPAPPPIQKGDYGAIIRYLQTRIPQEMARDNVAGLSIALVNGQELIWARGFGLADKDLGVPVTPNTAFRAGGISKLLSATVLRGQPSFFSLELPPYRLPQVGRVLVRSLLDRTVFVLGRALTVTAPAGLLIWGMGNMDAGGVSLLERAAGVLSPLGRLMGLDGMVLLAFLLGFPANEIVLPILLMGYLHTGTLTECSGLEALRAILLHSGWTTETALCMMALCLLHFPCGTTCLTIRRETGGCRWMLLAMVLPTAVGIAVCMLIHGAFGLLG